MSEAAPSVQRYLPRVLIATAAVLFLPLLTVTATEILTGLDSPLLSVAMAVALSFGAATTGAAYWARRPESRDIVFSDLMVWGWIRRRRTERRLAEATKLLGLGRSRTSVLETDLSPEQQAELLERLASSLEARDSHTHGHTRRVTRHAYMIASRMGLSDEQAAKVRTAAAVHDVGKMNTPREVLNKPGKLTDEEFDVIKRHPVEGAEMVASLGDAEITAMVRHHHERLDGRGYPDRLSGHDIPLGARIIAVADTFDAITSSRSYRRALSHKKALEILTSEAGSQLDPDAVAAFRSYYSGRRSVSKWTLLISAPQRLASALREAFQTAAVAPLANNAAAVVTTAVLGSSLAAPLANAVEVDHSAHRAPTAKTASVRGELVADEMGSETTSARRGGVERSAHRSRGVRAGRPGLADSDEPNTVAGGSDQGASEGPTSSPEPAGAKPNGNSHSPQGNRGGSEDGNSKGKGNGSGNDKAPDPSFGRPESPGRSGSAPGHANNPAPPGQGSAPPGQGSKPDKQEGAPPADPPSQGGGNGGNGGNGKNK